MFTQRLTHTFDDRVLRSQLRDEHDRAARMNHQLAHNLARMRRDADRQASVGGSRQVSCVEPRRMTFNARRGAREQVRYKTLAVLDIGKHITRWRVQQASAEA